MSERTPSRRLLSIDALRGLAMLLMVLDHARDMFSRLGDPHDVASASTALFLTRWVTHFCAPTFVVLAGVSAALRGARHSRGAMARFLVVRGAVLIALELTVVSFGWMHTSQVLTWQVLAALGCGMITSAVFVFMPRWLVAGVALFLVAGQDLYGELASFASDGGGVLVDVWRLLHGGLREPRFGVVQVGSQLVLPLYPVLPWIGLMLLGYAVGPWFRLDEASRRRCLIGSGVLCVTLFVLLRWLGRSVGEFGSSRSFAAMAARGPDWMALLNCEKYPPSLAYILMTIGLLFLLLAGAEWLQRPHRDGVRQSSRGAASAGAGPPGVGGRALAWLVTYGRAPLFFYLAHLYLLHAGARLLFWWRDGEPVSLVQAEFSFLRQLGFDVPFRSAPADFEAFGLGGVYAATAVAALLLYGPCRAIGRLKQRSARGFWSYL